MFESQLLDPVDCLSRRLFVPDAAGLVTERLQSAGVVRFVAAFAAEGARAVDGLDRPFLLDSWLEGVSEELLLELGCWRPARRGEVPLGAFLEVGGPSGEEGAGLAPEVVVGAVAFGAGLAAGIALLEERAVDPLMPPALELREALERLKGDDLDLRRLSGPRPLEVALRFVAVVDRLVAIDPELADSLGALRGLVRRRPGWLWTGSARRLHFLAGLLGAGVLWVEGPDWRCS